MVPLNTSDLRVAIFNYNWRNDELSSWIEDFIGAKVRTFPMNFSKIFE